MSRVRLQAAPFDPGAEAAALSAGQADAGALVSFTGLVRADADSRLVSLEIEHYPGMCEAAIEAMRADACTRWELLDALVIHRHGRLELGEAIMMVATLSAHRAAAFAAADFLMDYLKSRAPFWKREHFADGRTDWVDARDADEAALARWQKTG